MTREEAIKLVKEVTGMSLDWDDAHYDALQMAIKALEQQPISETDIILTREEYGELVSSEFDNGYAKGFREALEQEEPILDKIRAEIAMYEADCRLQGGTDECEKCNSNVFGSIYRIIDKYKAESEDKE